MAILLELQFTKSAILTAYINEVFILQQKRVAVHGFALASRMMFRRALEHLEPRHMALLVGMVQGARNLVYQASVGDRAAGVRDRR